MDSLERLFFSVSAAAAGLALLLFGLYFNIGDMVIAIFRPPAIFDPGIFQPRIREAMRRGVPGEILPDGRQGPGYGVRGDGDSGLPFASFNGPPVFPLEGRLKKERMRLVQKGFTDATYLEMETLFRADRSYIQGVYQVDVLVMRGDAMTALDELEVQIQNLHPKNTRALLELVQLRGRLLSQLQAPPDRLYDQVMQDLELQARIFKIEINGFQGIPKYRQLLSATEYRLAQVTKLIEHYRSKRSEALQFFATGAYADHDLDPSTARIAKAALERQAQRGRLYEDEAQSALQLVDTRVQSYQERQGIPDDGR